MLNFISLRQLSMMIPWGHLVPETKSSTGAVVPQIRAILVDEHGGQIKGIGTYFASEYPAEGDADWHVLRIVKVCQVHYERSINRLRAKGVSESQFLFQIAC
jgi:hypothetical protein